MRTALLVLSVLLALVGVMLGGGAHAASPVSIVAAELVYADVAMQIAGPTAAVSAILNNPAIDPHLFEAGPAAARAIATARILVFNGADYDPWMRPLLASASQEPRTVIEIAQLLGRGPGDNPHLWYDPAAMPAYARTLAADLAQIDPGDAAAVRQRLRRFLASLAPLEARIAAMRARYAGLPVAATEPVFGDMAAALGLNMRENRFQMAVMNDTEPSVSDIARFETDLRERRLRVLIYNSQASDPAAARLLDLARVARVPIVAVTETEPAGLTYQQWMLRQLDALDRAMAANG